MKNVVISILLVGILITGCSVLRPATPSGDMVATQLAVIEQAAAKTATQKAVDQLTGDLATAQAILTLTAGAPPTLPPLASPTLVPNPTATPTPLPTWTPLPSLTPFPTVTPIPSATPLPCNQAKFVADVTIPDGTVISPGVNFTKTWRLQNVGTCTWSKEYALVFFGRDRLGGDSPSALPAEVLPGAIVDVSVKLTAPTSEGDYRSDWKLRASNGVVFGVARDNPFYAKISVKTAVSGYAYDFVANYCAAEWTSGAGTLTCPSKDGDSKGFVFRVDNPKLETGSTDNESGLLTNPQAITDGIIRGKFPYYTVKDKDHFMALVMCAYEAKNCDVRFSLDYIEKGTDTIKNLGGWNEKYDDSFTKVDVDLSPLAGKEIRFILTVNANGEMKDDRAFWLSPRIVQK